MHCNLMLRVALLTTGLGIIGCQPGGYHENHGDISFLYEARAPAKFPYLEVRQEEMWGIYNQAAKHGPDTYFQGLLACSNHDPKHTATTLEKMQELSKDPPGCTGWRYVGVLTNNKQIFQAVEIDYNDIDRLSNLLKEGELQGG